MSEFLRQCLGPTRYVLAHLFVICTHRGGKGASWLSLLYLIKGIPKAKSYKSVSRLFLTLLMIGGKEGGENLQKDSSNSNIPRTKDERYFSAKALMSFGDKIVLVPSTEGYLAAWPSSMKHPSGLGGGVPSTSARGKTTGPQALQINYKPQNTCPPKTQVFFKALLKTPLKILNS